MRNLNDWLFRSIIFEADAQRFRDAGIKVGSDHTVFEVQLFQETLAPFPLLLRNDALRMSRIYALLYSFENSVRELIKERLTETYKGEWWEKGISPKIRKFCEDRKAKSESENWLQAQKGDLISFADFGNLSQIIIDQWSVFSDLFPSQHFIKQKLDELEQARNFIAHNRLLNDSEFRRIEMYVDDWNAQVGL